MSKQVKSNFMKRLALFSATVAVLCTIPVEAATTEFNNFTMLDGTGAPVDGTNDVTFTWDGSLYTSVAAANAGVNNATMASAEPWPFFGVPWTAYNVKVYGPGTYTISTADSSGGSGCPDGLAICAGDGSADGGAAGTYTVTVGAAQIMAHMKFAWATTEGIDVVLIWQAGDWTVLNPAFPIFEGPAGTYTGPAYDRISVDGDGDGIPGIAMIDGPFVGFNANFNVDTGTTGTGTVATRNPLEMTVGDPAMPGCSISAKKPSSITERGDWWLVAGFLAWLGVIRARCKRQAQS